MFHRPPHSSATPGEEENPYLLSFADIMAGLVGVFILALISVMILLDHQKQQLEEEKARVAINAEKARMDERDLHAALDRLGKSVESIHGKIAFIHAEEEARRGMLNHVKEELGDRVPVEVTNEGNVLRIPDGTLSFERGSYVIPPDKRQKADLIGAALLKELQRPENLRLLDTIFIEGHTDSVPNNREMGNWGLSTYRAISLWNSWTDKQGRFQALRDLKNARKEPLFSVSGYSDTRRVVEPSPEGLKALESAKISPGSFKELDEPKNRRIDLRFSIRGSEEVRQKLEEELSELEGLQNRVLENLKKP